MSPPGTFVSWFVMVFVPQVIVWVGIVVWKRMVANEPDSSHAVIYVCAGVLWALSIFMSAASNRGLFLTMTCACSGITLHHLPLLVVANSKTCSSYCFHLERFASRSGLHMDHPLCLMCRPRALASCKPQVVCLSQSKCLRLSKKFSPPLGSGLCPQCGSSRR